MNMSILIHELAVSIPVEKRKINYLQSKLSPFSLHFYTEDSDGEINNDKQPIWASCIH